VQIPDVNVYVNAYRDDAQHHLADKAWLGEVLVGEEPVGVSDQVLASFVRVVTHRRVFAPPSTVGEALAFCAAVRAAPAAARVVSGERHWSLFAELCVEGMARGNLVPDAYLAAQAIEHGATLVTHDRGFARFPGLRWALPEL